MGALIAEVVDADARAIWSSGIRGLRLNVDFLRAAGAEDELLQRWEHGRPLEIASSLRPQRYDNRPSMPSHAQRAEREWSILERLGKINFFPRGVRPPGLHDNPCAIILKDKEGVPADRPEEERIKSRII
eukprot:3377767-Pyramimonas_sp.AAC.1